MDNFKKINFLTSVQKNLINLCKLKTFVWYQYIINQEDIYMHYERSIKEVQLHTLEIDSKKINYYKLILSYSSENIKHYFVYKILIDNQIKNYDIEDNNYTSELKNSHIYPHVISFFEKRKSEDVDHYLYSRIFVDIKCLFKMEFEIKQINLITEKKYNQLSNNIFSPYCDQKLKKNRITYDDITFFFFYHPTLMPLKNIYGFEYYNINYANLKDIDILLKIKIN